MLPNRHSTLVVIVLLIVAVSASAQSQWLESKSAHYTVFYQAGFEKDSAIIRTWLDQIEKFMKSKYKVTPDHYQISVYLLPAPEGRININQSGENECCTRGPNGIQTGTIRLLSMSAPVWKDSNLKSSLGLLKSSEDYHYKVLMAEYIPIAHYAAQDAKKRGGWNYYSAPEWFVQGLQEYDAIFHTTEHNRTANVPASEQWAQRNAQKFSCCSPTLETADPHNTGAAFLRFLAAEFGEAFARGYCEVLRRRLTRRWQTKPSRILYYSCLQSFRSGLSSVAVGSWNELCYAEHARTSQLVSTGFPVLSRNRNPSKVIHR